MVSPDISSGPRLQDRDKDLLRTQVSIMGGGAAGTGIGVNSFTRPDGDARFNEIKRAAFRTALFIVYNKLINVSSFSRVVFRYVIQSSNRLCGIPAKSRNLTGIHISSP